MKLVRLPLRAGSPFLALPYTRVTILFWAETECAIRYIIIVIIEEQLCQTCITIILEPVARDNTVPAAIFPRAVLLDSLTGTTAKDSQSLSPSPEIQQLCSSDSLKMHP